MINFRRFAVPVALVATLGFTAGAASAQLSTGVLVGVVRDATGAVVPSASVVAVNVGTNVSYRGQSNAAGEYRIANLPNGTYNVTSMSPGFETTVIKGVALDANNVQTEDFALPPASQATTVEVSSQANVSIDTTTAQIGTTFSQQEIKDLPTATIGLGVLNLSLQAPGAVSSGGVGAGTGPSISGQRPRDNNFEIDGIDNNSKAITGPLLYVPNDSVQEFVLLENIYSAQYGHSTGGQFNSLIRTGTNSLHGGLYEYFQNRDLNAITSTQGVADRSGALNLGTGQPGGPHYNPRYDFNRYGGFLGGPIIRDKVFAFGSYERQSQGQSASSTICAPTAAGYATLNSLTFASATNLKVFEQYFPTGGASTSACATPTITVTPTSGVQTLVNVGNSTISPPIYFNHDALVTSGDYTISPKDTFRVRYVYNREDSFDTAASLPAFFVNTPVREHLASLAETHIFSPNLTNDIRFGYTRYFSVTAVGSQSFPGLNAFPSLYFGDLSGYGTSLGPDPNAPQETIQNLYDLVDNVTYVKGSHTINIGGEGRKFIAPEIFTQRIRGDYEYTLFSQYLNDLSPSHLGQRDATATGQSPTYYGDQSSIYLYVNDDYRVTQKLTLNLGVRWEFTTVPFEERGQTSEAAANVPGILTFGAPQPQYTNVVPRFGLVYAPSENTSIRAAFGISTDVLFDNLGENSAPLSLATTENVPSLTAQTPNFLAQGGLPSQISNAIFTDPGQERTAISAYIPNQVLPYSEQYTLGVQHVFAHDYTAEVRYVGTRGIHLDTQTQINSQDAVTPANQLPVNLTGGPVIPNGANTLLGIEAPTGSYSYTSTTGAATTVSCPYYRIASFCNAGFTSTITGYYPYGASNYNGLQTQLTRRYKNGLLLNLAYTYSRAFDDSTADVNSTALNPRRAENFLNLHQEYSRSDLDHPNRLSFAGLYDLHYFDHSNFLLRNLLSNFEFAPVYTFQSAQYATPQSGIDSNLNGDSAADRTFVNPNGITGSATTVVPLLNNTVCGAASGAATATGGLLNGTTTLATSCAGNTIGYTAGKINRPTGAAAYFTPDATAQYVQGGLGTLPTASRNTLPVGRIDNLDLTAVKRFSFRERYRLEVQIQAFNVLNHSQYLPGTLDTVNSVSSTGTGSSNYATVSSGALFDNKNVDFSNNARTMQLAAKFSF